MSAFKSDPAGLRFGSLWFRPGLSGVNVVTVNFAAFCTIAVITFMSFAQPYVLTESLNIPVERQGTVTGNLHALQEIVAIAVMSFFGAWSDRIGRRPVYVLALVLLGFGYFIYPLAGSEAELFLYRAMFAVGAGAAPILMSVIIQDSCQEISRGKWVATNSIFTGIGVLFMALVLAKTPGWYAALGADNVWAGRYAFWTTTSICFIAAIGVWFGMRGWVRPETQQPSVFSQVSAGLRAGLENPRLALSYAAAFIGRGDLVVISTFLSLWVVQYGAEQGMSTGQSLGRAGMLFGIVQGAALVWSYFMGMMSDRLNRISSLAIALLFAGIGYSSIGLIENPLGGAMIPAAILLGIGEVSVLIAAGAVLGQEAPVANRGAVVGVYGLVGGVGILFATYVGGIVFDNIGRTAPFVMMGILNTALMLVAILVRLRSK